MRHPSQNCSLLLDGRRCFKCLGPHPRSDCCHSIPQSPNVCPKCHLSHNGPALGNVPLHEGRYGVDCPGQIRGERYQILIWAIWRRNPSNVHKAMPELMNITRDKELARWMGLKAFGRSVTNFARLADACIRSGTIDVEADFKIGTIDVELRTIGGCMHSNARAGP